MENTVYCVHIQSAVMNDLNDLYDLADQLDLEVQIDQDLPITIVIADYTYTIGDHFLEAITWLNVYRDIGDHFLEACRYCDKHQIDLYSNYNDIDQGDQIVLSVRLDDLMSRDQEVDQDLDFTDLEFSDLTDDDLLSINDQEASDLDYEIASIASSLMYKVIACQIGFANRDNLRDLCLRFVLRYRNNLDDDDLDDLLYGMIDNGKNKTADLIKACQVLDQASSDLEADHLADYLTGETIADLEADQLEADLLLDLEYTERQDRHFAMLRDQDDLADDDLDLDDLPDDDLDLEAINDLILTLISLEN